MWDCISTSKRECKPSTPTDKPALEHEIYTKPVCVTSWQTFRKESHKYSWTYFLRLRFLSTEFSCRCILHNYVKSKKRILLQWNPTTIDGNDAVLQGLLQAANTYSLDQSVLKMKHYKDYGQELSTGTSHARVGTRPRLPCFLEIPRAGC